MDPAVFHSQFNSTLDGGFLVIIGIAVVVFGLCLMISTLLELIPFFGDYGLGKLFRGLVIAIIGGGVCLFGGKKFIDHSPGLSQYLLVEGLKSLGVPVSEEVEQTPEAPLAEQEVVK